MRKTIVGLSLLTLPACSAPSKSPYFKDDEILRITGQFLKQDGTPLADTSIALRNLRQFAYVNPTQTYITDTANWLLYLAFPFFPGFDNTADKFKAKYFIKNAVTAHDGTFDFQMRADQTLRDAEGGINISMVNDGDGVAASYAKYNFVIKSANTSLEPISLCDLGETVQETAQTLDWSWTLPGFTLDHYELRIADAQDNSLLWTSQLSADATQLSLPKSIFMAPGIRYAIEVFYSFGSESHMSCLTPSKSITISSPVQNLALNKKASGENISFSITSLTNGRFNDVSYLAAYDTRSVTLDLLEDTLISSISLHNVLFTSDAEPSQLQITAASQATPTSFESIGLDAVAPQRFAHYPLPSPKSYARIRISASHPFSSLQEVSVQ